MPNITINNNNYKVSEVTTILSAAKQNNIYIPNLCFLEGLSASVSCMLCIVLDKKTGKLIPACSSLAIDGMEIETENDEINILRKSALELLLSEHSGDCVAPCQRACPAGMDIPLMNRLIGENKFSEALEIIHQTIALPAVLGYICSAPCEKVCRRKDIDKPLSICLLKRFASELNLNNTEYRKISVKKNKKIAIIGAGIMGLSVAYYSTLDGFDCTVFDKNPKSGGLLNISVHENKLPLDILNKEIDKIIKLGAEFIHNTTVDKYFFNDNILNNFDYIVFTTGKKTNINDFNFKNNKKLHISHLTLYLEQDSYILVNDYSEKVSKMAIKAAAQGKKLSDMINQLFANNKISENKSNHSVSNYSKIKSTEINEFLKDSKNADSRIEKIDILSGLSSNEAVLEAKRCLHCDCRKKSLCKLKTFSEEFNAKQSSFELELRNSINKIFYLNNIIFEPQKCIKCGICIKISHHSSDKKGFTYIGRGFNVKVGLPFINENDEISEETLMKCIDSCPTGALAYIND